MTRLFHSWFGWWYVIFMLYMVTMLVYGVRGQARSMGRWLERAEGRVLTFRKPRALRRSSLMAPGVFVLMLFPMLYGLPAGHRNHRDTLANTLIKGYMTASVLGLSALFVYLGGPADYRLDGQRRVYEKTEGWPWRPKTRSGSLDDFRGVCITPQNNVMLVPRKPSRFVSGYVLGSAGSKGSARSLAAQVGQTTGIPLIDYPMRR